MPHRQQAAQAFLSHLVEGLCLTSLALWQGGSYIVASIQESDWLKITGPNGVAFVSVIAVIVLWGALLAYINRTTKREEARRKEELAAREVEDAARERRHVELIATQKENMNELMKTQSDNAHRLIELTTESITANINGTHAIQILSKNMEVMTAEIKERPCQITKTQQ